MIFAGSWRVRSDLATAAFAVGLLGFVVLLLALRGAPSLPSTEATTERVAEAYGKLPLSFVPNEGQTDKRVRYYTQGAGHAFYFTPDKVVLSFTGEKKGYALELTPLGANPNTRLEAGDRARGTVNYMVGSERHTNLPTYREVAYRDLWPGIDLVFRGQGSKLKYEFRLQPGADPGNIALGYRGADALAIGAAGNLLVQTPAGTLRDSRPESYQRVAGKRVPVASRYALKQSGSAYGFALGSSYDPSRPLVIDPGLTYSTFLGGSVNDQGNGIAVDGSGNAFVVGQVNSSNFPTTVGAFDMTHNMDTDVFVAKLASAGTALFYSTYLGGAGDDVGRGIAIDVGGNAYVTGSTDSTTFPTTVGALDTTLSNADIFVTKLNPTGSALTYSTFLGGGASDNGYGIALNGIGQAFVTGDSSSTAFPTTAGALDTTHNGTVDAVVSKLDAAGSALLYSTYLGGSANDTAFGVKVDVSNGEAYVTGQTVSSNFPTSVGAFDTSFNGGAHDAFVSKLNASGTAIVYSTYLGGTADDAAKGVAVDGSGNAYLVGNSFSTDFPTSAGAFDTSHGAAADAFVTKLNPAGSALGYSTYLGGSGGDTGNGIAVDASGRASVTGLTGPGTFPTTAGEFDTSHNGAGDAYVTRLNPIGTALVFSTFLGASLDDTGRAIAVDSTGNTYVTGDTFSTTFPTTAGSLDTTHNGSGDVFVSKLAAPTTGSIIVRKDAVGDDPQDFSFTAGGGLSPASFSLDDDADATLSNTRAFTLVAPGSGYSLAETVPAGWYQGAATCEDGSPVSNISVSAGEAVVCTFTNSPLYARPGSASPLRVPLVPLYEDCTTPNSTHVLPLDEPSCTPTALESDLLTTSTVGRGAGSLKLTILAGDPGTPADEADVALALTVSDVLAQAGGGDYVGKAMLRMAMRITDRANDTAGVSTGTVQNLNFDVPVDCVAVTGAIGSSCNVSTTLDALEPGTAKEGKRAVIALPSVTFHDAGPNGTVSPPSSDPLGLGCPPTCGNGDEKVFLAEGVFTP